jgi:hypothetical protein
MRVALLTWLLLSLGSAEALSLESGTPTTLDHSNWDHVLKHFVRHGLMDYEGLSQDRTFLDDYLTKIKGLPRRALGELSREERLALWLNVYNASVVQLILNAYPVSSVEDIPAFDEVKSTRVAGEYFGLRELRDHIFRDYFRDERVLVALVTGRMDSPSFMTEAFVGARIHEQLDQASRVFVDDENKNQIRPHVKKIFLSPLFEEYGTDFVLNYSSAAPSKKYSAEEQAVISFILHHSDNPENRLFLHKGKFKVYYLESDVRLNRAVTHTL